MLQQGPIAEEMVARVRGHKRPGTLALSDLAASAEYRKHLVTVYAKRAIERAIQRARA